MSPVSPSMTLLFEQLGLEHSPEAIQAFIAAHRVRPGGYSGPIQEAPFWTHSQSELLSQALADDSEWSGLVDRLDSALRQKAVGSSPVPPTPLPQTENQGTSLRAEPRNVLRST
ncbi:MAG: DUF2789 family protein [Proteobacteria bacterium]|nr:DUF2789 family protein [Pseudomonadota bacterium]